MCAATVTFKSARTRLNNAVKARGFFNGGKGGKSGGKGGSGRTGSGGGKGRESIEEVKKRTVCSKCGKTGHWHKDPECALNKSKSSVHMAGTVTTDDGAETDLADFLCMKLLLQAVFPATWQRPARRARPVDRLNNLNLLVSFAVLKTQTTSQSVRETTRCWIPRGLPSGPRPVPSGSLAQESE